MCSKIMCSWFSNMSVRTKLFFSYFLIFTLPLFLIGTFSYLWMSNTVKKQSQRSYENLLNSTINTVDQQFKAMQTMALQLSNTKWVKEIMYMRGETIDPKRIDPIELENYRQQLEGWLISNDFFSDIAIYFKEKNLVLSTLGKNDFEWFIEETFKVENMDLNHWQPLVSEYLHAKILSRLNVEFYQRKRQGLVYLQSLPFSDSYNIRATFIVFIEDKSLTDIFKLLFADQGVIVFITDEENEIVVSINAAKEEINIIRDKIDNNVNIEENIVLNNELYYSFKGASEINKWVYTILVPRKIIMDEVERIKIIIAIIVLASCVIGIILSYLSAIKHYQPLLKLIEIIRDKVNETEENRKDNEYSWLESNIQSILRQEDLLTKRLEQQKPILINTYLSKLISGNIKSNQEILKILNLLDVNFPYAYFMCCVISNCNDDRVFDDYIQVSGDKYDIKIYNLENKDSLVAIINYMHQDQFKKIVNFLNQKLCGLEGKNTTIAGIGGRYNNINQIHESYREANIALDYRLLKMKEKVIIFDELEKPESCYYYPVDEEYNITSYLKSGSFDKAKDTFLKLLYKNLEYECISMNALKLFFINIQLTTIKVIEQMELSSEIKVYPEDIYNFNTIDDMKLVIEELFRKICDIVNENKKSNNEELKNAIITFINNNYTDNQISLNMVASNFGISPSYLSRFFKEQFGCNFLDYVNRKRIELAKEQLSDNRMTDINTISKAVGYDSSSTFRRLFKKYEGVSPSQYRIM
jgi:AraC-like DNA-binding protein